MTMKRSCWIVCIALVLGGCADLLRGGYDYGTVRVRVVDTEGGAMMGVDVELYTWQRPLARGITDFNGVYEFRFVPLENVGVQAFAPGGFLIPEGKQAHVDDIDVPPGGRVEVELVFVKVVDEDGDDDP
jgi:hypothetical protein